MYRYIQILVGGTYLVLTNDCMANLSCTLHTKFGVVVLIWSDHNKFCGKVTLLGLVTKRMTTPKKVTCAHAWGGRLCPCYHVASCD